MFIALAPVVYMENIKRQNLKAASQDWEHLYYMLEYGMHLYEFNDHDSHKTKVFCDKYSSLCGDLLDAYYGNGQYHDEDSAKRLNQ